MQTTKQQNWWKRPLSMMLSIILIASSLSFAIVPDKAQAASAAPELIVDYEFTDQGSGNILPVDKKGNSTLAEVSGTHGGQTYGNTTATYGSDSTGPYWQWTTNTNRGGGFTLDIDPTKVGKEIDKSYTISVRFSYDTFHSSWTKILDYKNKTEDQGFYFNENKKLKFFDVGPIGSTPAAQNSIIDIIATRDDGTKKFTAYMMVDGVFQKEIEVNDTTGQAIPSIVDNKIRFGFFHDDYKSTGKETTKGGKVYSIKFWDGAVTPANVLEVTAAKGETEGSTKLTLPAPQTSENKFKVLVSDKLLTYPMPGDTLPAGVQDYTSETDLPNVDGTKNKYIGIYEVDSAGQIVGFRLITLKDNEIKANKQALRDKKNEIESQNLNESNYTPESWTSLQTALTKANAVLANEGATQQEVNAALAELEKAREGLKEKAPTVKKEDLQAKADSINNEISSGSLKEADYTEASWKALQDKLNEAKTVLDNPAATQEEVDKALADLKKAREGLKEKVPTVSKADLQAKADGINNEISTGSLKEADYTEASWKALQDKLNEAKTVLDNPTATQEEINNAFAALETAYNGLETKTATVDKSKLAAKVAEGNGLNSNQYTPTSWTTYATVKLQAEAVLNNPKATQAEVDAALAQLTAAQSALVKVPVQTPGLGSLKPSTGTLSPSFSSEVTNYTMNVDYPTSQLSFTALPLNPSAKVTMTANGKAINMADFFPLAVGENTVMITVTDDTGSKTYIIKVNRAKDTSSGSGGGGGSTWTPPTPPTETSTTTKIKVDLEVDGVNPMEKTPVEIERTKHANGQITDFVALTEANAKEAVQKAKQIGNNIARIVIPDVNDEVDKVTVEVPKQSIQTLRENGLSLEISTDNAHIAIPVSSMDGVNDNFYFRLVPVKKESERKVIEERARVEKVVRETLQSNDVRVVARPMTIETNMPSRPVQVTLPLKGVKVPTAAAERKAFLERLAVFIEHTDGEKKVVFPEVVTMAKGELGLRFTVDKFSTFTVIQFEKPTVSKHEAYIKGFPNGTFGPEENVTRAQVATMIARILGYTDDQTIDYAPFNDIPSNHYAAGAIAFVKERGIMNGDMNGNFRASENITRAQMATVVANYKQLQIDEGVAITFNDTKGHWAQWIIEANRTAGIINGREDGSFAPNEHLTRAQAVVMMNRMFERGPLNGVTTPSFPDVKAKHWAFKEIEEAAKSHSYFIDEDKNEQLSK